MDKNPRVIIIAGPNGAGKTTFAREFLPKEAGLPVFINADLIAAGLSPFNPDIAAIQAGRIMLTEIAEKAAKRESFAFETTLSGHGYARQSSSGAKPAIAWNCSSCPWTHQKPPSHA